MYAATSQLEQARNVYEEIEKDAAKIGRPASPPPHASGRRGWARSAASAPSPAPGCARSDTRPEARVARLTAMVLLARLDRYKGDGESSAALIEELRGAAAKRPVLLHAPRVDRQASDGRGRIGDAAPAHGHYDDRWIHVRFWITADGAVSEVEVLRNSGPTHWAKPVLRSIAGRTYAPLADPEGSYRVERYTYKLLRTQLTGSRMRTRSPDARLGSLDLTAEPVPAAGGSRP